MKNIIKKQTIREYYNFFLNNPEFIRRINEDLIKEMQTELKVYGMIKHDKELLKNK